MKSKIRFEKNVLLSKRRKHTTIQGVVPCIAHLYNCTTRCNTKQSIYYSEVPSTCFGCQPHPSSGVHKTVTAASGTGHIFCGQVSLATLEGGTCTQKIWPVPEAVVTVFVYTWWWVWLTPEICRVNLQNNRLLCVAFCWTITKHVEWTCKIIDCFVLRFVGQLRNMLEWTCKIIDCFVLRFVGKLRNM